MNRETREHHTGRIVAESSEDEAESADMVTIPLDEAENGRCVAAGDWSCRQRAGGEEPGFEVLSPRAKVRAQPARRESVEPPRDVEELVTAGLLSAGKGRIKIDQITPLEAAFAASGFLGGFLLFIACISTGSLPVMNVFSVLALVFLGVGVIGYRLTDNYYVVDLNRRQLVYHFEFLSVVQETVLADFQSVACITSHSELRHYKGEHWFDYATILILRDGTKFPLSNYKKDDLLAANARARLLAGCAGVDFVAGRENAEVEVRHDPNSGEVRIFHKPIDLEHLNRSRIPEVSTTARQVASGVVLTLPAILVGCAAVVLVAPFLMFAIFTLGIIVLKLLMLF